MFKLSEIKELIKLVDETSVQELEIENDGSRLFIRKPGKTEVVNVHPATIQPAYPPMAVAPSPGVPAAMESSTPLLPKSNETSNLHTITSPMVGTFYRASSPDTPPYVNTGDKVRESTIVCIIEAMKLMNELEAEVNGEIVEILVENGQLVEYGQPLFLVKPD